MVKIIESLWFLGLTSWFIFKIIGVIYETFND